MNTIFWIVGISAALALVLIIMVFTNMAFISEITQLKVQSSKEYVLLTEALSVEEVLSKSTSLSENSLDAPVLDKQGEMLLYEDGSIKEGRRIFDDDPGVEVIVVNSLAKQASYVFYKNDVFQYEDGRKGKKLGAFSSPEFSFVDFVLPVNDRFMIVHGSMQDSPYPSERALWQVDYDGLNKTQLSSKPYYIFDRVPKLFSFAEAGEQVVVYYVESFNFAFGGDSSRPKYSVVRIYNSLYPEGRDIIKFGFKAGTVIDVTQSDKGYLLTTDPSLPAMANKPRVKARQWELVFKR